MSITGGFTIKFGILDEPTKPDVLDHLLSNTEIQWSVGEGLRVFLAGEEIPPEFNLSSIWHSIQEGYDIATTAAERGEDK